MRLRLVLGLGAVGLAVAGEWGLWRQEWMWGGLMLAGALVLWLGAMGWRAENATEFLPPMPGVRTRAGWKHLVGAGGVAVLAGLTFLTTDESFNVLNVALWLLSVVAFLVFWVERGRSGGRVGDTPMTPALRGISKNAALLRITFAVTWERVALVAVLVVAGFFYFYNLDRVPLEMTSDHAEKLLDVNDVLNGARPVFFERNTGREPLEFYLVAALIWITRQPLEFMALKWITAAVGFLVVPATFWLGRELFDTATGLIAAALVGMSKWPVAIARMGLRFPFAPLFAALTLVFLFRAMKYRRRNDFVWTGIFLGAGLYGYSAFRVVPVLAAILLFLWLVIVFRRTRGEGASAQVLNAVLPFALALVIFVPLARYMSDHPQMFWYRTYTRLSNEEEPIPGNPVVVFADNVKNLALMFNVEGDHAWPNTIPGEPVLDFVSGGIFVLGIAYALYRLIRWREVVYLFVLTSLIVLILPSALSLAFPLENPSVVRTGSAIPIAFVLIALPLGWLYRAIRAVAPGRRAWLGVTIVSGILIAVAGVNYQKYFVDFDAEYRANSWNSSEVAEVIRGFAASVGDVQHAWIMSYPHWIDTRNVAIHLGDVTWDDVFMNPADAGILAGKTANQLFILNPHDAAGLETLRTIFPNAQTRVQRAFTPGKDFVVVFVPGK